MKLFVFDNKATEECYLGRVHYREATSLEILQAAREVQNKMNDQEIERLKKDIEFSKNSLDKNKEVE